MTSQAFSALSAVRNSCFPCWVKLTSCGGSLKLAYPYAEGV